LLQGFGFFEAQLHRDVVLNHGRPF
jgi:hypothetical protein